MRISEKVDNRTHVEKNRFVVNPKFPTDMKIELTARCNLQCINCGVKQRLRKIGDMDIKLYEKIITQAKDLGLKELGVFLLGESFLLPDLPEYIKIAKWIGIDYVYLTTNGTLCNPENLKAVMDAGLDSIKFSINAGSRENYKKITGMDLYDKVIDNFLWLADNRNGKIKLCVSAIYRDDLKDELETLKSFVLGHIEDFYYLPCMNHGGYTKGDYTGNIGRLENPVKNIPCWELFNTTRVSWDGKLLACSFDHRGLTEMANLKVNSLEYGWINKKFLDLRKKHLDNNLKDTICENCLWPLK